LDQTPVEKPIINHQSLFTPPIPKTVKGLSLVSLFNDFASEMIYPLLPAFVTQTLGGGAAALGALDGAADLTAAGMKWVSGQLADQDGGRWRRALILWGYLTAVLIRPLISISSAAWQVIGFRVLDRVGKGVRTPPRDALIAEVTPNELQGRAFGFHRAADHFGAVLGSLVAWLLLRQAVDIRRVIAWSAAPGILAFLVLFVILRSARPAVEPAGPGASRADAQGRVFWAPVLVLAALTLLRLPEALILLRLQDLGVAVPMIPLAWAGLHVVRTASSYPGGWLGDHLGPRRTVAAGGVLFGAVMLGLGYGLSPALALLIFLVFGLVAGLTESSERLLVARLAPVKTGRGFGAYHAVTGLAALPSALAFGVLYQRLSGPVALWASAGAMLMGTMAWMVVARDRAEE
jgi:MFS family permease